MTGFRLHRLHRPSWLLAALLTLGLAGVTMVAVASPSSRIGEGRPTAHQLELRAQVDTARGAPREGRDPAAQKQTSLAEAASKPQGNGARPNQPVAAARTAGRDTAGKAGMAGMEGMAGMPATKDHTHDVAPSEVLPAPSSGALASGCATGYGKPGAQCLPAVAPGGGDPTCVQVRTVFPKGVAVTGTDRFGLDRDGDGIACDSGDR